MKFGRVTLPAGVELTRRRASAVLALQRAGVPRGGRRSILVVDDDPVSLRLVKATLDYLGYCSRVASGGADALAQAARDPPAVVVIHRLHLVIRGSA